MNIFNKDFNSINLEDIENLKENKIEESLHLDYKEDFTRKGNKNDIDSKELAKDISSFANTEGGYLIYGVKSSKGDSPEEIVGIEINPDDKFKEKIEQIIRTTISRSINCRIKPIEIKDNNFIFLIYVPKSLYAPHRVEYKKDFRYYKRGEFESTQMQEYEIRDLYQKNFSLKERMKSILDKIEGEYNKEMISKQRLSFYVLPIFQEQEIIEVTHKNKTDLLDLSSKLLFGFGPINYSNSQKEIQIFSSIQDTDNNFYPNSMIKIEENGNLSCSKVLNLNDKLIFPSSNAERYSNFLKVVDEIYKKFNFNGELAIGFVINGCYGFEVREGLIPSHWKKLDGEYMFSGFTNTDSNDLGSKVKEIVFEHILKFYKFCGYTQALCFDKDKNIKEKI